VAIRRVDAEGERRCVAAVKEAMERSDGKLEPAAALLGVHENTLKAWLAEPAFAQVKRRKRGRPEGSKKNRPRDQRKS
jgi:hypothetical protein